MPLSKTTTFILLAILSLASVVLALFVGSVTDADAVIIYQLRLPRVLAAFAVGGLLAMSGSLLQVLTRNLLFLRLRLPKKIQRKLLNVLLQFWHRLKH